MMGIFENTFRLIVLARVFASVIFLVFGVAHIATFASDDDLLKYHNEVFPLWENYVVFQLAGIMELVAAGFCYINRNNIKADCCVLLTITTLIWYRAARATLGAGGPCGCSGILGNILHLTGRQEHTYTIAGLFMLGGCLVPFVLRSLGELFGLKVIKRSTMLIALLLFLPGGLMAAKAQERTDIELQGMLSMRYLSPNGTIGEGGTDFVWTTRLAHDGSWSIRSTNSTDPAWKATAVFDGIDTYIVQPSVIFRGSKIDADTRNDNAEVSEGPLLLFDSEDLCQLSSLWVAFCSKRALGQISTNGDRANWPIPLWHPRQSVKAWGFQWQFSHESNIPEQTPFADVIQCVRNTFSDPPTFEDSLLRAHIMYPLDVTDRTRYENQYSILLQYQLGDKGFVYKVSSWRPLDNLSVPGACELSFYAPGKSSHLYQKVSINVEKATLLPLEHQAAPKVVVLTSVDDYRFEKKTDKKQMVSEIYRLIPGDAWKSRNDPDLVSRAADRWKNTAQYPSMVRGPHVLLWLLLIMIIVPIFFLPKYLASLKNAEKQ